LSLGKYADEPLRGESELTVGERETLAACVSQLSSCNFCHGNHKIITEIHGVDPDLLELLLDSPGDSGIDEKGLPLLTCVRKLTESPSRVTDLDARLVFDAGCCSTTSTC
jgi:AhpD family alkylhydroperoxidase